MTNARLHASILISVLGLLLIQVLYSPFRNTEDPAQEQPQILAPNPTTSDQRVFPRDFARQLAEESLRESVDENYRHQILWPGEYIAFRDYDSDTLTPRGGYEHAIEKFGMLMIGLEVVDDLPAPIAYNPIGQIPSGLDVSMSPLRESERFKQANTGGWATKGLSFSYAISLPPWAKHKYLLIDGSQSAIFQTLDLLRSLEVISPDISKSTRRTVTDTEQVGFEFTYPDTWAPVSKTDRVPYQLRIESDAFRLYSQGSSMPSCECDAGIQSINTVFPPEGEGFGGIATHHVNQHGVEYAIWLPVGRSMDQELAEGVYYGQKLYIFKTNNPFYPVVNILINDFHDYVTDSIINSFKLLEAETVHTVTLESGRELVIPADWKVKTLYHRDLGGNTDGVLGYRFAPQGWTEKSNNYVMLDGFLQGDCSVIVDQVGGLCSPEHGLYSPGDYATREVYEVIKRQL